MSDFVMVLIGLIGLCLWAAIVLKWQRGLWGLLLYIPFAGAVSLSLYPSKLPLLFKDILFVVPAYFAFFLFHSRQIRNARLPQPVFLSMLALAAMVILQMVNPSLENWLVAAIGAKVWLFYMPVAILAGAAINSREDLTRLFRVLITIAIIPCLIGIYQWFGSATIGYHETLSAFYGDVARQATQGFGQFQYGGSYFRIPSTFTYVTQYFGYTWVMMVVAYSLMRIDPSPRWRRFSQVMLGVLIVAAVLSGSRAGLVFVPLLLVLTAILDRRLTGIFSGIVLMPVLILAALYFGGIDPIAVFQATSRLAATYSEEGVYESVVTALEKHPFGAGTGMNTGPARHAFPAHLEPNILESYYAKAIVELGVIGLMAVLALFTSIILVSQREMKRIKEPGLRSCAAAMIAFFISITIHSGKGWQIDVDPINVYFWVLVGIMFKLSHLPGAQTAPHARARPRIPYGGHARPVAAPAYPPRAPAHPRPR